MDASNIMYMNCQMLDLNKQNEETIIIKMDCNNLVCAEVYWSKFKIIHLAIVENKEIEPEESSESSNSMFDNSERGISM